MKDVFIKRLNKYFHDEEAKYFARRHAERIGRESRLYKDLFDRLSTGRIIAGPARILDIGTGKGLVPNAVPAGHRIVCADISYDMLKNARADMDRDGSRLINYVVCDAEKLPFRAGTFDIVTSNAAMHHFPSITDFSNEAKRVLAAGGALIVGFEPNRRFWTNRLVSLPYRLMRRLSSGVTLGARDGYEEVCAKVNKRLADDGATCGPLSLSEMMRHVDVHSPNAGGRIDYSKGFDIDELVKGPFRDYEATAFYHYDEDSRPFGVFNRFFFPKSAPQFSLFLKKKTKARIKVLYLFVHTNFGGAEVGLLTTLRNIDRSRFDCIVVSIEKKGAVGVEIEKMGIRVIYLDSVARIFNFGLVKKIARILKQETPDILHTSLFYANFFGRLAAIFHRPPVLVTEERSMYTEKRFYHVIIDNLLSHMTDRIITCSKSVTIFTRDQEKIPESKFHLIYNAVDSGRFDIPRRKEDVRRELGFTGEDFVIGTVGSVIPKKGHRFLIEALAMLKKDIPLAKLVIAGDGESRSGLVEMAKDLGISDKIFFLGFRSDIPEVMKAADVFVLPSLQEGFPRTIIEAMYMGLPVIASNISGIPEIIMDGENGFLVPAGNPEELANRILSLYGDPPLRDAMGLKAKGKIESGHLPQNYINDLQSLYEELLLKRWSKR